MKYNHIFWFYFKEIEYAFSLRPKIVTYGPRFSRVKGLFDPLFILTKTLAHLLVFTRLFELFLRCKSFSFHLGTLTTMWW